MPPPNNSNLALFTGPPGPHFICTASSNSPRCRHINLAVFKIWSYSTPPFRIILWFCIDQFDFTCKLPSALHIKFLPRPHTKIFLLSVIFIIIFISLSFLPPPIRCLRYPRRRQSSVFSFFNFCKASLIPRFQIGLVERFGWYQITLLTLRLLEINIIWSSTVPNGVYLGWITL